MERYNTLDISSQIRSRLNLDLYYKVNHLVYSINLDLDLVYIDTSMSGTFRSVSHRRCYLSLWNPGVWAALIPSGIHGFFRLSMNFVKNSNLSLSYKAVIKNLDLEVNVMKTWSPTPAEQSKLHLDLDYMYLPVQLYACLLHIHLQIQEMKQPHLILQLFLLQLL